MSTSVQSCTRAQQAGPHLSRRPFSQLTMAGSRWSKNRDAPVSIAAIRVISLDRQREVENVEVLLHAFPTDRFRDDDDVALDEPSEHDLGDGLVVGVT